jgi:hypothetical protein
MEVSALELAEVLEGFGVVHQPAPHPSRMSGGWSAVAISTPINGSNSEAPI